MVELLYHILCIGSGPTHGRRKDFFPVEEIANFSKGNQKDFTGQKW